MTTLAIILAVLAVILFVLGFAVESVKFLIFIAIALVIASAIVHLIYGPRGGPPV